MEKKIAIIGVVLVVFLLFSVALFGHVDFPSQHQVLDYIQSYAHHFDLLKHIKFNTKVVGIEYEGASDEEIGSWSSWNGIYQVDFVILWGGFDDVPNMRIPSKQGSEAFHGKVIHSMEYVAMDYKSLLSL
ncbi:hypothetical protein Pint_19783 [Pistacia integerrima]|uniref:Uncharacterized protein n=1 Tax=Pistacia integerrima TaxID=434235 RepID=A0ACC0XEU5_9ROSI|nr:hypothetical protein Pint_19783 [Pistacia integerrima]